MRSRMHPRDLERRVLARRAVLDRIRSVKTFAWLLGPVALAVACSSSSSGTSADAGPTGGDSAMVSDAPSSSEGGAPSCPTVAPTEGSACGPQGLACEYGSAAVETCDTVATCNGGRWVVAAPSSSDATCQTGTAAQCPGWLQGVGQHCDDYAVNCDYPQGRCSCTTRMSPTVTDASAQATWICPSPDPSCPLPRPRVGTPCSSSVECDYGTCAIPGATAQTCTGGVWTEASTACPG
jgi:hypothetical protein